MWGGSMYMGPSKLKLIRDPIYKEFHMLHKYTSCIRLFF